MAQEENPVVHVNSPAPPKTVVANRPGGNFKAAGKSVMKGVTRSVNARGAR